MKILTLKSTFFSLTALALLAVFLLNPSLSFATQYYVSTAGNDSNNGTSQNTPFKTLAKVNGLTLKPGDKVLLKGGNSFTSATNSVGLKIKNSGTAQAPIEINSYGGGKAIISASSTLGVLVEDASHIIIKNLIVRGEYVGLNTGANVESKTNAGILVKSKLKNCDKVLIENVEVSKFKWSGIRFDSENAAYAVQNSTIRNCRTFLNGNRGIGAKGKNGARNKNILIENCITYDNHGWNEVPTGSGIHVSGSNGIMVQNCVAYNNGKYNESEAGGFGIWASSSSNVLFQFNESHSNKTRRADGGGFDIDGGVQNAVVQYNYSHDNDGAGFLVYQHNTGSAVKNVTVRYNISQNDGLNGKHASIDVNRVGNPPNGIENVFVYNNTVFTNKESIASIKVRKNEDRALIKNVHVYNNLLIRPNTANAYIIGGSNVNRKNNHIDTQFNSNNSVVKLPGQGTTLLPNKKLNTLDAYRLKNNQAVVNKGLNLKQQFGFDVGVRDFYGVAIPKNGAFDIGASEFTGTENPIPQPCTEKLKNANFATGSNLSANWNFHKSDGTQAAASINEFGVAQMNLSNAGSFNYNVQLWQDGLDVKANKSYKVVAKLRADGNRKVNLIVRPVNLPNGGQFYMNKTLDLTSDFKTFIFEFTSPVNESNARLSFLLGGDNKNVFVDQVSFIEDCTKCEPEQILQAGGFDNKNSSNIFGWTAHAGGGASMNSSINQFGVAHLNINNGGANNYDLQLWQDGLSVEAGNTYVAKVSMRATANKIVQLIARPVELLNGEAFFAKADRGITTDFKEYSVEFTANRSETNARFSILMGGSNADVFIDYVTLTKVCNNKKLVSEEIANTSLANIYPNPTNDYINVALLNEKQNAKITLFDLTGKSILTQQINQLGDSRIDLSGLSSGSYLVRIQTATSVSTQRIVKY